MPARFASGALCASVAAIALDEFNLPLGVFTLKPALAAFALALCAVPWAREPVRARGLWLWGGLFALASIISLLLNHLGTNIHAATPGGPPGLGKALSLAVLILWAQMLKNHLTPDALDRAAYVLLALMVAKSIFIARLYFAGEVERIWWSPSGAPRFALRTGGMTVNQQGAIWLALYVYFAVAHGWLGRGTRTRWIALATLIAVGGVLTGVRSFVVGVGLFHVIDSVLRGRVKTLLVVALAAAAVASWYVDFEHARLADESALSRLDAWVRSMDNIRHNFFFGSGLGSDPAPHNTALQLLSECGVVGTLLFALMWVWLVHPRQARISPIPILLIGPYLFFLAVDIGLLQWQTWWLFASAFLLAHANAARLPCPPNITAATR